MKPVIPKLSVSKIHQTFLSRPTSKISFHLLPDRYRIRSFATKKPVKDEFAQLNEFNRSSPSEASDNPRTVLFINDLDPEVHKQQLFSLFNKVARLQNQDPNPVSKIKKFPIQRQAAIWFKTPEHVEHVMKQKLLLSGKPLKLSRHRLVQIWEMMQAGNHKVLFQLEHQPEASEEELREFFATTLQNLGKEIQVKPFGRFAFHLKRGVMEFPNEQEAFKACELLRNTKFHGMWINFWIVKPKEVEDEEKKKSILVKEDQLAALFKNKIPFMQERIDIMNELKEMGYNFATANTLLLKNMMNYAKKTRNHRLLYTICNQATNHLVNEPTAPPEILIAALIDCWSELYAPTRVEECVELLKKHYQELKQHTYHVLIKAYGRIGQEEKSFKIFEHLKQSNAISMKTILSVLTFLHERRDFDAAFKVVDEAAQNKMVYVQYYRQLVNTARASKQFDKISLVLQHMRQHNVAPDFAFSSAMLAFYASVGDIASTLQSFEDLKVQGWVPDSNHYFHAIRAHIEGEHMDGAMKWFRRMSQDGLQPNPKIVQMLLTNTMDKGIEDSVEELIQFIQQNKNCHSNAFLISLIKKWKHTKATGIKWEPIRVAEEKEERTEEGEDEN